MFSTWDHPINRINFENASQLCDWLGGRVCTEREWNPVSVGVYSGRDPYDFGKQFVSGVCNHERLVRLGENLKCNEGLHHLYDMGGSLAEWVITDSGDHGVKWVHYDNMQHTDLRARDLPAIIVDQHIRHHLYGVRCCADPRTDVATYYDSPEITGYPNCVILK